MAVRLRAVCDALSGAFSEEEFERVLLDFGVSLDELAAPGAWPSRVYAVVLWAQRSGRLAELVTAARQANPGNDALRGLAGESVSRGGVGTANTNMNEFRPADYGNGVQHKLGQLESDVGHLKEDFTQMRSDISAIRAMLQGRADRWTPGLWLATSIAFAALVTAGALWVILLP